VPVLVKIFKDGNILLESKTYDKFTTTYNIITASEPVSSKLDVAYNRFRSMNILNLSFIVSKLEPLNIVDKYKVSDSKVVCFYELIKDLYLNSTIVDIEYCEYIYKDGNKVDYNIELFAGYVIDGELNVDYSKDKLNTSTIDLKFKEIKEMDFDIVEVQTKNLFVNSTGKVEVAKIESEPPLAITQEKIIELKNKGYTDAEIKNISDTYKAGGDYRALYTRG
jgi:hypothetical protein